MSESLRIEYCWKKYCRKLLDHFNWWIIYHLINLFTKILYWRLPYLKNLIWMSVRSDIDDNLELCVFRYIKHIINFNQCELAQHRNSENFVSASVWFVLHKIVCAKDTSYFLNYTWSFFSEYMVTSCHMESRSTINYSSSPQQLWYSGVV